MESNIKASFIPDKITPVPVGGRSRKDSSGGIGDILILISVVILAVSLALAAGIFLYDKFLQANVLKKSEQLQKAREAFEPSLIEKLVRLDARINSSTEVLKNHLAPSALFGLLEQLTLQSISYDTLKYTVGDDGIVKIDIRGRANSVNGVARQASVFGENNFIENPIFYNLNLDGTEVLFDVSATLNTEALSYENIIQYSKAQQGASNNSSDNTKLPIQDNTQSVKDGEFGGFGDNGNGVVQ